MDEPDRQPPAPEDPEAAIEAIAEEPGAPPRQRRLARAAAEGLRQARRSARIGIGAAVLAALVAIVIAVVALTGGDDGDRESRASAVTDDIVAAARPGTVLVRAEALGERSSGSGVVVDADEGLVLTNFHVVGIGGEIEAGRAGDLDDAELKAAAPCEDLALLQLEDPQELRTIELGSQADLRQGDPVVALGYPPNAAGREQVTATAGVVSNVRGPFNLSVPDAPRFANVIQTDAALSPGNSGGPLVGEDGRLVGVNTVLITPRVGGDQGYALGVDRVKEVLADLDEGRSHGWFGAGLIFPSPAALRRERLPDGVITSEATDGTSADDADLEGVLITAIDGKPTGSTLPGYCKAVEGIESGDSGALTVLAGPRRQEERVTVEFE